MLPRNVKHVHFVGIGGYGMSALAMVLLEMGYRVSGSDLKPSGLTERLSLKGAHVFLKHDARNVNGCDLVVYSTAIPPENPELRESATRNLPLWHRSELLAALLNSYHGLAVAGTHGKTTTTAMLSMLLERGGLDPTFVIGGEVSYFGGNARLGRSPYLVAEACESDTSFLRYRPRLALVTNIEADHLEHYDGQFENLKQAYEDFLLQVDGRGCAVLCVDDPHLREISGRLPFEVITYAVENDENPEDTPEADFTGRDLCYSNLGSRFLLCRRGADPLEVELKVPGRHNVSNAVGAMAAAVQLGVDPGQCAGALKSFRGAGRRFEIMGQAGGITVVDDYAHHPTEIRATLQAARSSGRRIISIFQPHRYTRTRYFLKEFAGAFTFADMVFLHRIYPAGEPPLEGITSENLAALIREHDGKPVFYDDCMETLAETALELSRPGDIILTMGAGDIWKAARHILDRLQCAGSHAPGSPGGR